MMFKMSFCFCFCFNFLSTNWPKFNILTKIVIQKLAVDVLEQLLLPYIFIAGTYKEFKFNIFTSCEPLKKTFSATGNGLVIWSLLLLEPMIKTLTLKLLNNSDVTVRSTPTDGTIIPIDC